MNVFDTKSKIIQKDRASKMVDYHIYDYLRNEKGCQMVDRMYDIKRKFDVAVDYGCGRGYIGKHLTKEKVENLIQCDISEGMLKQSNTPEEVPTETRRLQGENFSFDKESVDLVVSCLSLHWVNNLPGFFEQVRKSLKSDGCFLGCMFGGDTLYQLRVSLQLAELEREGGIAAHISPFTENRDLGRLLTQTGFTLPSIDVDEITVNFPTMFELMHDLKGMGENNCSWTRKSHLHRETLMAAAAIYHDMYGHPDGTIPATFHFIHFIGWKPDPSQPKPAQRGAGEVSLMDLSKLQKALQNPTSESNL